MEKQRWTRIETIVDTALTLSGQERSTYISESCGEDKVLLQEVRNLLEAIEESEQTRFLEGLLSDNRQLIDELPSSPEDNWIGTTIGHFTITDQLGSGGMGTVYKAERSDGQFAQQVAVKLLQKGVQSKETVRRFRQEQEILAGLQHPGIARLYDGGLTGDGLPYLVMEYVDGVPIDQYCSKHTLGIDARIALFKDVCSAVQFAHANLVIHRDLKAQNIYVTNEGNVKVFDFGIAKLLDPKLTEQTLLKTRPGQKFWTPQYAAPEQVLDNPITTATDVYALGVLLHKLMAGSYPLDLKEKAIPEIKKIITKKKPFSMSQAVQEPRLKKKLAGDLDALVLKTLRKEPEYRYNSVGQLIEEIERYQDGLPLTARRDTVSYRIGKFYRRHKTGIGVAGFVLLIISGLIGFYTWRIAQERDEATLQAQKADQTADFVSGLFMQASPNHTDKANITAREILDAGAEDMSNQPDIQPEIRAKVLTVIGEAYLNIQLFEKADSLVTLALNSYKNLHENQAQYDFANAQLIKAKIQDKLQNHDDAEKLVRSAIAIYEKEETKNASAIEYCKEFLTEMLHNIGKIEGNRAGKEDDYLNDESQITKAESANRILQEGFSAELSGKYDLSIKKRREALALYKEVYGERHASTTFAMQQLGLILFRSENYDEEAESLLRKAVKINEIVYKEYHTKWAYSLQSLASILTIKGAYDEAKPLFKKALSMAQSVVGPDGIPTLNIKNFYGDYLIETNQFEAAEKVFSELENVFAEKYGKDYLLTIRYKEKLAIIAKKEENLEAASVMLKQILNQYDEKYGSEYEIRAIMAQQQYGHVLLQLGEIGEAEQWIQKSINVYEKSLSNRQWKLVSAKQKLGLVRIEQKRLEEAEKLLADSYDFFVKTRGPESNYTKEAAAHLVYLYSIWGKTDKMREYQALIAEN